MFPGDGLFMGLSPQCSKNLYQERDMFSNSIQKWSWTVLLCLIMVLFCASAVLGASLMTKIDLGVRELTLEVGESYRFRVTYEPEEQSFHALKWNISDDSVLEIDPTHFTVKALRPGTARILAESLDGYAYDICTVTVSGTLPKDAIAAKSGSEFITISAPDREKITSFSIKRFLDFLEGSEMTEEAFAESARRVFMVTAAVTPGTEDTQSQLALSLGMQEAEPLRNLHLLTLRGTLEQILRFTAGNDDLKEVYEEHLIFADKPARTDDDTQKAVTLEGYVEELTSVSTAHDLGYKGKGSTIAVIDTGVDPDHPEFTGRVIGQRCYGTEGSDGDYTFHSPCVSEDFADPRDTITYLTSFNHGLHTTGIAAGNGGIAPEANIVAIQVFTDIVWTCTEEDSFFDWCPWEDFTPEGEEEPEIRKCCANASNPQDTAKAFDYLIGHAKDYPNLTAVNLSMANNIFHETACDDHRNFGYFQSLLENGIIPVVASGNEYKNNSLPESACTSNSFTVGALANKESPILADFSNHNDLVNMAAPGQNIKSAKHKSCYEDDGEEICSFYGTESGTSMAAPMVTGAFAIMKQIFPNRSPEELEQTLIDLSAVNVTKRNICNAYYLSIGMCPAEYAEITELSVPKPILDFSGLKDYLEQQNNSIVKPVTVTIVGGERKITADPDVLFAQYFSLTANGLPMDLGRLTLVSRNVVKGGVIESHYRSENYPDLDIIITEEEGNRVSIRIEKLPEFTENGNPIAYAIIPTNSNEQISGTIYNGYVISFASSSPQQMTFFRFPESMQVLPQTGFSALHPQKTGEKPLSLNYKAVGLKLEIPSLDVITNIVQVPFMENEYPVQWLGAAAGLLEESALPGQGVSILTGHNHLSDTEIGPFAFLSQLEPGTKMFVLKENEKLISFTVIRNDMIDAEDVTALETIVNQFENTLTLLTCENELTRGGYANRRVVTAIPD